MFNNIKITYPRRYLAEQISFLFLHEQLPRKQRYGFASSSIRVSDITQPDSPAQLSNLNINKREQFQRSPAAHRGRLMFAASMNRQAAVFNCSKYSVGTFYFRA